MRRWMRFALTLLAAMAAFRLAPGLAGLWQGRIAQPALAWLHRLTAALAFPLLEPLALVGLLLCLRRRTRAAALAVSLGMYALLWYPAYFAAPAETSDPPGDVSAVCAELIDRLNDAPLDFDAPFGEAGAAASLPGARVKPARYPEWMRAMDIAGLFSPWTGEALVDAAAPEGYLPFTCVHELMHLRGVADEGAANIAAYRACTAYGGAFADSARLWALRYALGRLDDADRARLTLRMGPRLRALTVSSVPRTPSPLARLLGIGEATRDYDALLGWLTSVGRV